MNKTKMNHVEKGEAVIIAAGIIVSVAGLLFKAPEFVAIGAEAAVVGVGALIGSVVTRTACEK